jgi:hypothetical protein
MAALNNIKLTHYNKNFGYDVNLNVPKTDSHSPVKNFLSFAKAGEQTFSLSEKF